MRFKIHHNNNFDVEMKSSKPAMIATGKDCERTGKAAEYRGNYRLQESWIEHGSWRLLQASNQAPSFPSHLTNQVRATKKYIHQALQALPEGARWPENKVLTNSTKVRK